MQCEVAIGWSGRFLSLDKTGDLSCSMGLQSTLSCAVKLHVTYLFSGATRYEDPA